MNIAVAGLGYVGTTTGALLAQHHNVVAFDIDENKVQELNNKISPIPNKDVQDFLSDNNLAFHATTSEYDAFHNADYIFIAVPTNFSEELNTLDTSPVDAVVGKCLIINPSATIVIRSTLPTGYTEHLKNKYKANNIVFVPEFLREKHCLHDALNPSRIIIGDKSELGHKTAKILLSVLEFKDTPVCFTNSGEAEAIKLFANAFLALRVSFFNEIDSFASSHGFNTEEIIKGVSLDPRIGDYYNTPSSCYGGHCLPKDTRQLLSDFKDIPKSIVLAIVEANKTRKQALSILQDKNKEKQLPHFDMPHYCLLCKNPVKEFEPAGEKTRVH